MPATGNQILDALPAEEFERFGEHLERQQLPRGAALVDPYEDVTRIFFPIDSVISLTLQDERGQPIEVSMVGPEGLMGSWVAHGPLWSPWWAVCQVEGSTWILKSTEFRAGLAHMPVFVSLMRRYELAQTFLMSQSILCNRFHDLVQRAARWLLVMRSKTPREPLPLTHEFLSQMLGAHRPSVSLALQTLAEAGLIETVGRGQIRILDHGRLEAVACECFRVVEDFTRAVVRNEGVLPSPRDLRGSWD